MNTEIRIKKIIKELGLNNSSFAKKIGVSPTTIDGYTKGRRNSNGDLIISQPSFDAIHKICSIFHINAEYLLGLSNSMFNSNKNSLNDYSYSEVLDYLLEKRNDIVEKEKEKLELTFDVFGTIYQKNKIDEVNDKVEELKDLIKNRKSE